MTTLYQPFWSQYCSKTVMPRAVRPGTVVGIPARVSVPKPVTGSTTQPTPIASEDKTATKTDVPLLMRDVCVVIHFNPGWSDRFMSSMTSLSMAANAN